jgi:hypothetical protein
MIPDRDLAALAVTYAELVRWAVTDTQLAVDWGARLSI